LNGRPDEAEKRFEQALAAAKACRMPYEEGLANYYSGCFLRAEDPKRQAFLSAAVQQFAQIGAAFDQSRAESALYNREDED
jgi:hypothetical protein